MKHLKQSKLQPWLLAALSLSSPSALAQTNLITNGSFEEGPNCGSFITLPAGSTAIKGWKVERGSIDCCGTVFQTADGNNSIDLAGNSAGAIGQSFPTEVGKQYQILFDLAGNTYCGNPIKVLRVSADSQSQEFSFDTTGHSPTNMGWLGKSFVFTATNTTTHLTFAETREPGCGSVIDNVRVSPYEAEVINQCATKPQEIKIEPVLKWAWTGSTVLPQYNQVMHAPVVAPLEDTNGDGKINELDTPSVIFHTFAEGGYNWDSDGVLRAISGKDGHELWTVTNPAYRTLPAGELAVADIDGDGKMEIIAPKSGGGMIAFNHQGQFKWQSPFPAWVGWGGAAIADLDGDGKAEIVVGNTVLNADGSLRWQGQGFTGDNGGTGPLSVVADINLDGQPEIIAGATAYSNTGQVLWQNNQVGDGFAAIGNFNKDPYPEIVIVSRGRVFLLDHQGKIIWGPVAIPGGGDGGAPTIADVNGDGRPEIGVAGAYRYVILKATGEVLWQSPTSDGSSNVTGSSVFDFDGDGQPEVVYADEQYLRIYRGKDGTILSQIPNSSFTTYELPVIVDVDNDHHADIVVCTNYGSNPGIRVYQDKHNQWLNTRHLWNQHSYHVTNINDNGSVPRVEENSWQVHNTYRLNIQPNAENSIVPAASQCSAQPATCQLYAIDDRGIGDSQLYALYLKDQLENVTLSKRGPVWVGFNFEGLAMHPFTKLLYVSSGKDATLGRPKGALYTIDADTGQVFLVGATGFTDVKQLSFSADGTLYGWATDQGLISIDTKTGQGQLVLASTDTDVEPFTVAPGAGTVFYGAINNDLWRYDKLTGQLDVKCPNALPPKTGAMTLLSDQLLLLGTLGRKNLPILDIQTCQLVEQVSIPTPKFNDVEGLVVGDDTCQLATRIADRVKAIETVTTATPPLKEAPQVCLSLDQLKPGDSVEGAGKLYPDFTISTSSGKAVVLEEGKKPVVYTTGQNTPNGCLGNNGFGDLKHRHDYTFTLTATGKSFSNFLLQLLDYGDLNAAQARLHSISLVGYDATGEPVATDNVNYTTAANATIGKKGDACTAQPGEVGNHEYQVTGTGITQVKLLFSNDKTGNKPSDPNIAVGKVCFTVADNAVADNTGASGETGTPPPSPPVTTLHLPIDPNSLFKNPDFVAKVNDGLKHHAHQPNPLGELTVDRLTFIVDDNQQLYLGRPDAPITLVTDPNLPLGVATVSSPDGTSSQPVLIFEEQGQRYQQLLVPINTTTEKLRQFFDDHVFEVYKLVSILFGDQLRWTRALVIHGNGDIFLQIGPGGMKGRLQNSLSPPGTETARKSAEIQLIEGPDMKVIYEDGATQIIDNIERF